MTITYHVAGVETKLSLVDGVWSGGHDGLGDYLNQRGGVAEFVGRSSYYASEWEMAQAVASTLRGVLDEPRPKYKKPPAGQEQ